ncbi:MAG: hypothetical protein IKS09_01275 [Lachnospiraceae bacterium]|jgi:hypothetical protein|nr:hypothetical protein [Lachnospiraceae bacterium]
MKIWAKMWLDTHLIKDTTVEVNDESLNRTRKIFKAIDQICYDYDLQKPVWLDKNIDEFKARSKTRFSQDNFIESIDFDYLEIQVLEE